MGDCTGACCAAFYMKYTIRDFKRKADSIEDGAYIADMVIPLTVEQARERAEKFGGTLRVLVRDKGHHYTCRHWDEKTRLCTAYEERPRMCREFPYDEKGCTLGTGCCFVLPPEVLAERKARLAERKAARAAAA